MKFLAVILTLSFLNLWAKDLNEDISPWVKKMTSRHSIDPELISWSVIEVGNPKNFHAYNEDKEVIPASLTKILTAWHALEILGEDHRFETTLHANGKIQDGVLKGDLTIKGTGDPFFTNAMLMNLAMKLKNAGISKVTGRFLYDQSHFPRIPMISKIGLGDQTYNPGISALSLEFNRFTVWKGHKTIPLLNSLQVMKIQEKFTPGRRFREMNVGPNVEAWALSSKERYQRLEEVPIRKAALIFSDSFRMMAKKIGVILPSPTEGNAIGEKIATQYSQPLGLLVKSIMEYSNNMMAELILLNSTNKKSLNAAASEMKQNLKSEFEFLSTLNLQNGSGLDSKNRMNSKVLTQFLAKNFHKDFGKTHFISLFSISGQSGWMLRRLNDPNMAFNVWAKTGSLDYIDNIAGYLFAKSGKVYAFSLFINDMKKRNLLDGPNSEAINQLRSKAKKWKSSSKLLIDTILRHWHKTL